MDDQITRVGQAETLKPWEKPITTPHELAHVLSEMSCDAAPLHERTWQRFTESLWRRLPLASSPHSPKTSEALADYEALADVFMEGEGDEVIVRDYDHRPWIVWDTEGGDILASSLPHEDDGDPPRDWSRRPAQTLAYPLTRYDVVSQNATNSKPGA